MTKILYISPEPKSAVSFYRGWGVLGHLQKQYPEIQVIDGSDREISWTSFSGISAVFMERPCRSYDVKVAHYAKANGVPVWCDWDDDLLNVPREHESYFTYSELAENVKELLGLARVVTVSTERLQREFSVHNSNIHVVPNAYNPVVGGFADHNKDSKVILYRGSRSHYSDLEEYAEELIDAINDTHGYTFFFLGLNPFFISKYVKDKSKIEFHPEIDIFFYFMKIKQLNPVATIIPLEDHAFNRGKSNIAYMESTIAGAVAIAPRYLPEFCRPGALDYTDGASFYQQIKLVTTGAVDTRYKVQKAKEYIKSKLDLNDINKQRYKIIKELAK